MKQIKQLKNKACLYNIPFHTSWGTDRGKLVGDFQIGRNTIAGTFMLTKTRWKTRTRTAKKCLKLYFGACNCVVEFSTKGGGEWDHRRVDCPQIKKIKNKSSKKNFKTN